MKFKRNRICLFLFFLILPSFHLRNQPQYDIIKDVYNEKKHNFVVIIVQVGAFFLAVKKLSFMLVKCGIHTDNLTAITSFIT